MVPFVMTDNSVSLVVKNKAFSIAKGDECWLPLLKLIKANAPEEELLSILDKPKAVKQYSGGAVEIVDEEVLYRWNPCHNTTAQRILTFLREGLPYEPLCKFLEKLMANPSFNSRNQLYTFLERNLLPINSEGNILFYKAVTADFKDKKTQTIDNSIGAIVEMHRSEVDDSSGVACGSGLHCGALSYVSSFASGDDKVIIVEVDPKDVVSVPSDYDCTKVRCCLYKVIALYEGELSANLYTNDLNEYELDNEEGAYNVFDEDDDWLDSDESYEEEEEDSWSDF